MSCYFIFILDYRNDVKQKENLSDYFELKMGCKEVGNNSLHQHQIWHRDCQHQCSGGSTETRALKMRSTVASR